jgi:hypothetical protein
MREARVPILAACVLVMSASLPAPALNPGAHAVGPTHSQAMAAGIVVGNPQIPMTGHSMGGPRAPDTPAATLDLTSERDPYCIRSSEIYNLVLIYAHPFDEPSHFTTVGPRFREDVKRFDSYLHNQALATGSGGDFRVECDSSGTIIVHEASLPTPGSSTTSSTIFPDIYGLGYTDVHKRYLIFADATFFPSASTWGLGFLQADDTQGLTNLNDGNAWGGAWGGTDTTGPPRGDGGNYEVAVLLHELMHGLGAVQYSAPHSTGTPATPSSNSHHCWDGTDIMCYNDLASDGWRYTAAYCPDGYPLDCGHDDYFNRTPAAASYLALHWNVGDDCDRFILFDGILPGAPRHLIVDWSMVDARISWQAPPGCPEPTQYEIFRDAGSGFVSLATTAPNVLSYTDASVLPCQTYRYFVVGDYGPPGRFGPPTTTAVGSTILPAGGCGNPGISRSGGAVFPDGFYVSNGRASSGTDSTTFSVLDNSGAWTSLPDAPTPRSQLAAVAGRPDAPYGYYAAGGKGPLCTGPAGTCATLESFDGVDWHSLKPMPTPRAGLGLGKDFQSIYAVGGRQCTAPGCGTPLGTLEIYDTITDSWTTGPSMPTPREDIQSVTMYPYDDAGCMYLFAAGGGGRGLGTDLNSVDVFDTCKRTWFSAGSYLPMPYAVRDAVAAICGDQLYVIGGTHDGVPLAIVQNRTILPTSSWASPGTK